MSASKIETLDAPTSTLTLGVDADLYPRDVIYGAAYVFLDRAYVVLDKEGERFLVHLRGKQAMGEPELRALGGEFENELLAQALRRKVAKANQRIIETITALAIGSAAGAPAPAEEEGAPAGHAAEGEAAPEPVEFLDDPLGMAKPWEPERKEG